MPINRVCRECLKPGKFTDRTYLKVCGGKIKTYHYENPICNICEYQRVKRRQFKQIATTQKAEGNLSQFI